MRAPRTVRSPIGVSLPSLEGAAFPAVETTEQADFIDFQYGPGGRVVPGAEMDAKWTAESKNVAVARENACRERESNPYALTSTAP